jgi:iron complex transport system substrate-binding protein
MPRIVSLLPSATEIVCALGFRDALVGRSHECDFPSGLDALPVCTAPRIEANRPGAEIHREVTALLRAAASVYDVQVETLERLAPDVIVTQTLCAVCAVSLDQVERAVREVLGRRGAPSGPPAAGAAGAPLPSAACDPAWLNQRPASPASQTAAPPGVGSTEIRSAPLLVNLEATNLAAVWVDVARVAAALGAPERGAALVRELKRRLWRVGSRSASLRPKPRIAVLEWLDPPMGAGNWMPELITLAGGENLFGRAGEHTPWLEWDALVQADPDAILVAPCGFSLDQTRAEARGLPERPGWAGLKAVREGRVALTDGHQFFNRPGPRLVESAEILAEILHPRRFDFGHRGRGWEPMGG